jgi:hypothetical protein
LHIAPETVAATAPTLTRTAQRLPLPRSGERAGVRGDGNR